MGITSELNRIQIELKAPKSQRNEFGRYNYRSCEDILEAVKPHLGKCVLTLTDTMTEVGGRVYVMAEATISDGTDAATCQGWAREADDKKGMDQAQITGAASSYARKYALNGLFCIDDTRDPDATNTHGNDSAQRKEIAPREIAPREIAPREIPDGEIPF